MISKTFLDILMSWGGGVLLGLSILSAFKGEFEKATPLALYAILAWLMIPEKQGPV